MPAQQPIACGEDTPPYSFYKLLQDLVQDCTPETLARQEVAFAVDGFDPQDLFLSIYVRPHPKINDPLDFPLAHLRLVGSAADARLEDALRMACEASEGPTHRGLMYGTGAFRSLVSYLEAELPGRGFKRIFLECVENERLGLAAERYGFERIGSSKAPDYVKTLAA